MAVPPERSDLTVVQDFVWCFESMPLTNENSIRRAINHLMQTRAGIYADGPNPPMIYVSSAIAIVPTGSYR
jgi:hypothetical protein